MRVWFIGTIGIVTSLLSAQQDQEVMVTIQREAHALVESVKRRYPAARFTFVLSNEPDTAAVVAQNLERLQQIAELEQALQSARQQKQEIQEGADKLRSANQQLQEELKDSHEKAKKYYLLLTQLDTEQKAREADLLRIRQEEQQAIQEKQLLVSEVDHYRNIVRKMETLLGEVPEIVTPQQKPENIGIHPVPPLPEAPTFISPQRISRQGLPRE